MLDSFLKQSKPMLFRRKETITGSDDPRRIFYLYQGYVRLYTVSKEGSELTLHIFPPYSIFPILWNKQMAFDQYYFESLTPVEVYSVEKAKLLQFIEQTPDAALEILQQLSLFTKSTIKKLEFKIFGDANQQVMATLLNLAECFGKKDKGGTVIAYWFTHQDIASFTGLSRERVTIELNNLLSKGVIYYNNHFITIPKIGLFEEELE